MFEECRRPVAALMIAAIWLPAAVATADQTPGTEAETETAAPAADIPEAQAQGVGPDTVLMIVNGTPITLGELIALRQTLPSELQRYPDEFLMTVLMEQLRDQQLLAAAAKARGLDGSKFLELALRNQARAVLADAYMADELVRRVNEAEIQRVYEERYVNAEGVEEVRAAHIVVESEAEAQDLKAQLDGGADFAALAGQYSLDEAANQGGDLGWFARDEMAPAFAEAAFDLADGTVSDPVESPYGWHLIKLDGRRDRPVPSLADVQGEIIGELSTEAQNAILAELRAAAKIEQGATALTPDAVRQDGLIAE